jgi:cob(I)alamin adenosyltransferase
MVRCVYYRFTFSFSVSVMTSAKDPQGASDPETHPTRPGSAAGDTGFTDLLGGQRVPKDHPVMEAIGALDEATSALGMAKRAAQEDRTRRLVHQVQADLYEMMAELAFPPEHSQAIRIKEEHVAWLDRSVATVRAPFVSVTRFVLPGAAGGSAALDFARAVVRTTERRLAHLQHEGALANPQTLAYANRLSLLLYYLARAEDAAAGVDLDLAGTPAERAEAEDE